VLLEAMQGDEPGSPHNLANARNTDDNTAVASNVLLSTQLSARLRHLIPHHSSGYAYGHSSRQLLYRRVSLYPLPPRQMAFANHRSTLFK
jgi:hypothetical protein